jgi:hypothetical protein
MTRLLFASALPSTVLASALAITLGACGDASTMPTAARVVSAPSSNVLSIGDLRRAVPNTPCVTGAYRQFDFWLGEWFVTTGGVFDGTNNVTSELDGCLVFEHWAGAGAAKGWSMNTYDQSTGLWYQHWVDESGLNLVLSGGLQDGTMVLSGPRRTASGVTVTERIAYTPLPGGQMRQFWQESLDGGATFPFVAFDGLYDPRPGVVPPAGAGTASCAGPNYRAADFMLGEWRVEAANGLDLGHSSITAELSRCLVFEQFSTPKGYRATAFLSFARGSATWSRTYMDAEGGRIFLQGTPLAGGLALSGTVALPDGNRVMVRITWTKTTSGSVEQVWDVSRDGGASWSFDQKLVYVPA